MSKLKRLLLFIPLFMLTACLPTIDGKYLIYKTETVPTYGLEPSLDYKASERMLDQFKGRQFDLKFKPKYAILREENGNEDMILNEVANEGGRKYELTYTKNKEKVKLTLYDRAVEPKDVLMFIAIHEQVTDSIGETRDGRYGLIECHLTKPTN